MQKLFLSRPWILLKILNNVMKMGQPQTGLKIKWLGCSCLIWLCSLGSGDSCFSNQDSIETLCFSTAVLFSILVAAAHMWVELERVPNPAGRPEPEEKLSLNKLNTRYYPSLNYAKAESFLGGSTGLKKNVGYTRLEWSLKNFKRALGSSLLYHNPALARARSKIPKTAQSLKKSGLF